jgi:Fe-S cluster assembly protein SufD
MATKRFVTRSSVAPSSSLAPAVQVSDLGARLSAGDAAVRALLGSAFAGTDAPVAPTSGTVVEIPAGVVIDDPIVLNLDGTNPAAGYTFVHVGAGSLATIIERRTAAGTSGQAAVCEVIADEGARLIYAVVDTVEDGKLLVRRQSRAAAGAHVDWNLALIGSAETEESVCAELAGAAAGTEIAALFFPIARETVALTTEARHTVAQTTSDTVVRTIAAGRGRGRYHGNIRIEAHAHAAEASLRDNTLLIGSQAKVDAIPALEIAANDVRAFHGATVGAIDEEHIFYLMSRGIERAAAEELIALGFFETAIARFPTDALRDELRAALAAKLARTHA